jgi:hypothetical protein
MQNLIYDAAQVRINEFRWEIADVVLDPDRWLITPHDLLGDANPSICSIPATPKMSRKSAISLNPSSTESFHEHCRVRFAPHPS